MNTVNWTPKGLNTIYKLGDIFTRVGVGSRSLFMLVQGNTNNTCNLINLTNGERFNQSSPLSNDQDELARYFHEYELVKLRGTTITLKTED